MKQSTEIYEHLAKVYLGSSRERKQKRIRHNLKTFRGPFKVGIAVAVCLILVLIAAIFGARRRTHQNRIAIVLASDSRKINYDFNLAKQEAAIFGLRNLNLLGFKTLQFRVRKTNYRDNLHMRVELVSDFGESAQVYIKQIPTRWQDFSIDLDEFKNISDWSYMRQLLFVIEEWNTQSKKGIVYIDNVNFMK